MLRGSAPAGLEPLSPNSLLSLRHWVAQGLEALEARLASDSATGRFCHGDTPGLADCCLVPQVFNARRFKCDLTLYPTVVAIEKNCQALEAFQRAAPGKQPDAEG